MRMCASLWSYEDQPALRLGMDAAACFPARLPNFKSLLPIWLWLRSRTQNAGLSAANTENTEEAI